MASAIIIPIVLVAIVGLTGYLMYRFILFDMICRNSVSRTLKRYNIRKTPYQIVEEFHKARGENLAPGEIKNLEKQYIQDGPDQFLSMFDAIRER